MSEFSPQTSDDFASQVEYSSRLVTKYLDCSVPPAVLSLWGRHWILFGGFLFFSLSFFRGGFLLVTFYLVARLPQLELMFLVTEGLAKNEL